MKTREDYIHEIVKEFDWIKVHNTMTVLKWNWVTAETNNGVPTIGDLMVTSVRLLQQAYDGAMKEKKTYHASTGGFKATAHVGEGELWNLELEFILTHWDVYIGE